MLVHPVPIVIPTRRSDRPVTLSGEVPCRISADVSISLDALPAGARADLVRTFTKPNPEWAERERHGRATWGVPRELCYAVEDGPDLRLPRGAFALVRAVLIRHGVRLVPTSSVAWRPAESLPADAPRVPGRDYQVEAEDRLLGIHPGCPGVQGGIVLPCGGGKTTLGARAIYRSQQSAIVVCHTNELLEQWARALAAVGGREARVVRSAKDLSPLYPFQSAVAMVQTLGKAGPAALPLLRSAGVVLADEAHHLPAESWYAVVSRCPARYRWWLSATPEREDGLGFVLPWTMGPVLLRRTPEELAAAGWLVLPKVVPVRTGWQPDPWSCYTGHATNAEPRLDWHATSSAVAADPARNELIVRLATAAARGGRTTIVLVSLVEHAEALASQISSAGVFAAPVTGDVAKGDRRKRIEQLRSGRLTVAVATSLADEGLDVPRLGCVILAAPQKTWGRSQQRIGRLTRPWGGKGAGIAIDLVDGGPLQAQYRRRARAYEEALGYPPEPFASPEAAVALLAGGSGGAF